MDRDNTDLGLEDECNTSLKNTVNIFQTARCHIPKDGNLHAKCLDNFNSQTCTK
jgi:hypothetical protein